MKKLVAPSHPTSRPLQGSLHQAGTHTRRLVGMPAVGDQFFHCVSLARLDTKVTRGSLLIDAKATLFDLSASFAARFHNRATTRPQSEPTFSH